MSFVGKIGIEVLPKPDDVKWSKSDEIGEFYVPFVTACFSWSMETQIVYLEESKLADAFRNPNVQTIKEITIELKKRGKGQVLGTFLLELGRNYSRSFFILYVYLYGHIPDEYSRYNLIFLGISKNLADVLRRQGLINCDSENRSLEEQ